MSDPEPASPERPTDSSGETTPLAEAAPPPDLDAIESDLDGVEKALDRLADGTYWTDEKTGAPIPDTVLEDDPTTRSAG